eukprot:2228081-Ditylum_brightwellii.AAC.1
MLINCNFASPEPKKKKPRAEDKHNAIGLQFYTNKEEYQQAWDHRVKSKCTQTEFNLHDNDTLYPSSTQKKVKLKDD